MPDPFTVSDQLTPNLKGVSKAVLKAAFDGLGEAGMQLLADSVFEIPTVPHELGSLRGSGAVHLNGKLIKVSTAEGDATPMTKQITKDKFTPGKGSAVSTVSFNKVYATYQHEGQRKDGTRKVRTYTEPSSGKKFMEIPMRANKKTYNRIIADRIRKAKRK